MVNSQKHSHDVGTIVEANIQVFLGETWISHWILVGNNMLQNQTDKRCLKFQPNLGFWDFFGDWRSFIGWFILRQCSNSTYASIFAVQSGVFGVFTRRCTKRTENEVEDQHSSRINSQIQHVQMCPRGILTFTLHRLVQLSPILLSCIVSII
jgi:hypothetical protein